MENFDSKCKSGPKISAIRTILHNTAFILLLKLIWLDLNLCMPGIHKFKSVYAKAYTAYTVAPPIIKMSAIYQKSMSIF